MKRTPLRRVSNKRRRQTQEYQKARAHYLNRHPFCEGCRLLGRKRLAVEIHHKAGREGKLLCDSRHFMATCRECHESIHRNPRQARALGFIYDAKGERGRGAVELEVGKPSNDDPNPKLDPSASVDRPLPPQTPDASRRNH